MRVLLFICLLASSTTSYSYWFDIFNTDYKEHGSFNNTLRVETILKNKERLRTK